MGTPIFELNSRYAILTGVSRNSFAVDAIAGSEKVRNLRARITSTSTSQGVTSDRVSKSQQREGERAYLGVQCESFHSFS